MSEPSPELLDFLSRTPFFAGLWDRGLDWVAQTLIERAYPAGGLVFSEGDQGSSMFVVKSGELLVQQSGASGRTVRLMHMGPRDFFGESSLIEMQPRPFTVRVEKDAVLYELTNVDLYRLYQQDVKAYVLILQNLNRELCHRLRRAGQRLTEVER